MPDAVYGIDIDALEPERPVAFLGYPLLVIRSDTDVRVPVGHGERVDRESLTTHDPCCLLRAQPPACWQVSGRRCEGAWPRSAQPPLGS